MKKTWVTPKAEELSINATKYGTEPTPVVDGTYIGIDSLEPDKDS